MTNTKDKYNNNFSNPEEFGHELSKIKKENNFQVPENYFDELPQQIKDRVTKKKFRFSIDNLYAYFTRPFRTIAIGSLVAVLIIGLIIISNQQQEDFQISVELSFDDMIQAYPEMIEYMDDNEMIEFAAAEMDGDAMGLIDLELGFDSILFQNELMQQVSDEELIEIMYNL